MSGTPSPPPKSSHSPWRTTALVKPPSRCNLISANIYSLICTPVSLSPGSLTTTTKWIDFPNLKKQNWNKTKLPTQALSSSSQVIKLLEKVLTASTALPFYYFNYQSTQTFSFFKNKNNINKSPFIIPISFPEMTTTVTPRKYPEPIL